MDRRPRVDITRVLGIALVVGLFGWSLSIHRETVAAMTDDTVVETSGPTGESLVETPEPEAEPVPKYLAFSVGLASGAYDISDLPGSRDRDYTERVPRQSADEAAAAAVGELNRAVTESGAVSPAFANYVPDEQGTLTPGLYGTAFDAEDCSYQLRRVMRTRTEKVIGQEYLASGRLLVTINEIEPDRFIAAPTCGNWVRWSPVAEPLEIAENGDYWIGDLRAGTWETPTGCIWEKVVGFRGASLWDVEESARSPKPLVVDEDTLGVRIRGCSEPMTRLEG